MKYLITLLLVLTPFLHAEYKLQPYDQEMTAKKLPIVDIRTTEEWKETGIVKGSIPIQFFNELGQYDIPKFLEVLNAKVDTSKEFALICRTGSRTQMVGLFLSDKLNYKIIDIKDGILDAHQRHAPIVPYKGE